MPTEGLIRDALCADQDVEGKQFRVHAPLSERLCGFHGRIAGITAPDLTIQIYPEDYPILLALRSWGTLLAQHWHPQC